MFSSLHAPTHAHMHLPLLIHYNNYTATITMQKLHCTMCGVQCAQCAVHILNTQTIKCNNTCQSAPIVNVPILKTRWM